MRTVRPALALDETITLDINGSQQRVRLCATQRGLPPLVIVQHGPGVPLLHEVAKFQQRLQLERSYLVVYWEQRGCGNASAAEARRVSLAQQVDDLRAVLRWVTHRTQQNVLLFGISIGATLSLMAAAQEAACVRAVVANSPDLDTRAGDAAVDAFLHEHVRNNGNRRARRRLTKLGPPPYLQPRSFQRRAALLADFGSIERGKTFLAMVREMLAAMLRTYGIAGTAKALRNMNIIQRRMLADLAPLDLVTDPPRLAVPVHFVFGADDALTAAFMPSELPARIGAPGTTAIRVADAGHLVHFDRPDVLRSVLEHA
jgi:pimeloyl-ACP methyl ester carboxylesterase